MNKTFRFIAIVLAACAVAASTGCQSFREMSQTYQLREAEKAAKARDLAEAEAFNSMSKELYGEGNSVAAYIKETEENRKAWEAKHPGEAYYSLPWSAAPGTKRVDIGGKSYYCAPTETGDIHCE